MRLFLIVSLVATYQEYIAFKKKKKKKKKKKRKKKVEVVPRATVALTLFPLLKGL